MNIIKTVTPEYSSNLGWKNQKLSMMLASRLKLKRGKFEKTGAILFTIRIHLRKLKHVIKFEGIADQLSKAFSSLPPEMHTYKQTHTFADSVQAYLDQF